MTVRLSSHPVYLWCIHDTKSPWRKKGGWRQLAWEMTEADAAERAKKNGFEQTEKVPGKAEREAITLEIAE